MTLRPAAALAVMVMALAVFIACGSDTRGAGEPEGDESAGSVQTPAAPLASPTGTAQEVEGQGGIDPACVQAVLGRPATGFADVTAAERQLIFSQCSPQGPRAVQGQVLPGGPVISSAGIDFECAAETVGRAVTGFQDLMSLTEEERAKVFEECMDGDFQFTPVDPSQLPGGGIQIAPGQGIQILPGGGVSIDSECIRRALGQSGGNMQVTPEQRAAAMQECGVQGGNFVPFTPAR